MVQFSLKLLFLEFSMPSKPKVWSFMSQKARFFGVRSPYLGPVSPSPSLHGFQAIFSAFLLSFPFWIYTRDPPPIAKNWTSIPLAIFWHLLRRKSSLNLFFVCLCFFIHKWSLCVPFLSKIALKIRKWKYWKGLPSSRKLEIFWTFHGKG